MDADYFKLRAGYDTVCLQRDELRAALERHYWSHRGRKKPATSVEEFAQTDPPPSANPPLGGAVGGAWLGAWLAEAIETDEVLTELPPAEEEEPPAEEEEPPAEEEEPLPPPPPVLSLESEIDVASALSSAAKWQEAAERNAMRASELGTKLAKLSSELKECNKELKSCKREVEAERTRVVSERRNTIAERKNAEAEREAVHAERLATAAERKKASRPHPSRSNHITITWQSHRNHIAIT